MSAARAGESPLTDAQLVGRVRKGDSDAFEALVRRYVRAAHATALYNVRSPDQADDVCQDAFLTALQRIDQCRDPANFRAWLLAIVRNRSRNLLSREKVREATPLDSVGGLASGHDPGLDAERGELGERLNRAIATLTGHQKRVFVLHDVDGYDHGEIAHALGISRGASRVHLHLARRAMRAVLGRSPAEEV